MPTTSKSNLTYVYKERIPWEATNTDGAPYLLKNVSTNLSLWLIGLRLGSVNKIGYYFELALS